MPVRELPIVTLQQIRNAPYPPCYDPVKRGLCDEGWMGNAIDILLSATEPRDIMWVLLKSGLEILPPEVVRAFRVFMAKQAALQISDCELTSKLRRDLDAYFADEKPSLVRYGDIAYTSNASCLLYFAARLDADVLVRYFVHMRLDSQRALLKGHGVPDGMLDHATDLMTDVYFIELMGVLLQLCRAWRDGEELLKW